MPPLLSRLYRELAELQNNPYPGVDIFTDDRNFLEFCLVLSPPSGPWTGLSLHFDVEIPHNWPTSPPGLETSVIGIEHPNLFGRYICCDLLKDQGEQQWHIQGGYTGGYTPALSLRGLFLQFLTFFSSTKVEQDHGGWIEIGDYTTQRFGYEKDLFPCPDPRDLWTRSRQYDSIIKKVREAWNKLPGPELVVGTYSTSSGDVVHKTKSAKQRPNRIHMFEVRNPRWSSTLAKISTFACKKCPYGSAAMPHERLAGGVTEMPLANVPASLLVQPSGCPLKKVNDDALSEIFERLPSESLLNFCGAFPRANVLSKQLHTLLQRELVCFFLRTPLRECILGIGIQFDPKFRTFSSDFDWLSETAFNEHGVRNSIQKRSFSNFLPLAFSPAHFDRAYPVIVRCLETLYEALDGSTNTAGKMDAKRGAAPPPPPRPLVPQLESTIQVIYRMMNNITVTLMKSCDDALQKSSSAGGGNIQNSRQLLFASERAVISYCHLFHLLICLTRKQPAVLADATRKLSVFMQNKDMRTKENCPDLGEFIVVAMLVLAMPQAGGGGGGDEAITWEKLSGAFLQEATVRNVRWILRPQPTLEVLEDGASDFRLHWTFDASKTSLRLIMFQVTFLYMFIDAYAKDGSGGGGFERLDANYGFPEAGLPEKMVEEIKAIYRVDTWPAFFQRGRFTSCYGLGKADFSRMLRGAIQRSAKRQYHRPSLASDLAKLRVRRGKVEAAWVASGSGPRRAPANATGPSTPNRGF